MLEVVFVRFDLLGRSAENKLHQNIVIQQLSVLIVLHSGPIVLSKHWISNTYIEAHIF